MSTHIASEVWAYLNTVIRDVADTGEEAIITDDDGQEIAVIISMPDYERLHEHADAVERQEAARGWGYRR